ncbi:MAG TPA: TlpA disulfide reductase family protein [Candidatus Acidoferrales bacterium]|nr:TlpA disulfide reductase family protein [Candidatus Acidoferrales bacterium]
MNTIVAGQTAPDFSLKSIDGREYSLQKLLARGPVFVSFFKVSCPVCQFTFPFLERLYQRYGGKDVTFLGISQDNARATKEFADEYGFTFPVVLDAEDYPASNAYGLTNVPTSLLIETDGSVKIASLGFNKKDLEDVAAELSRRHQMLLSALFRPDESVPAHRPG